MAGCHLRCYKQTVLVVMGTGGGHKEVLGFVFLAVAWEACLLGNGLFFLQTFLG